MSVGIRGALLRRCSLTAMIVAVAATPAMAAELRGQVVDSRGAPLPGALVEAGGRSTAAGPDGRFVLTGVAPGAMDVTVAYVGYGASILPVVVADDGGEVTLALKPADAVSEVVVSGARAAERRSLQVKKVADNFVEALYANDVGKLPDQNVAEAVRRLPGVSVANDQGEGRYVIIRGVDPRYVNVTVNGQTAAAPSLTIARSSWTTSPRR